jgi:hypothetical protein
MINPDFHFSIEAIEPKGADLKEYLESVFRQKRFMVQKPKTVEKSRHGLIGKIKDYFLGKEWGDFNGYNVFDQWDLKAQIRLHADENDLIIEEVRFFNDSEVGCFVKYGLDQDYVKVVMGYDLGMGVNRLKDV